MHGLRQRLRQPTRGQDRDPERDENDRQLRGVVDDEHVRREPAEYRIAELGDALDIEEFAHDEKPALTQNVKRSLAEAAHSGMLRPILPRCPTQRLGGEVNLRAAR